MKEESERCQEWLPRKNRRCAAMALPHLSYCGNHKPLDVETRIPCPIDPSHSILEREAAAHARRCSGLFHVQKMEEMPYYRKGVNAGSDDDDELENDADGCTGKLDDDACDRVVIKEGHLNSKLKRTLFNSLSKKELKQLVQKIEMAYDLHCSDNFQLTIERPDVCSKWVSANIDRRIPFQAKHVLQQASMLGNMESFGLLQSHELCTIGEQEGFSDSNSDQVFIEFGAGRGYLAHMLVDCYNAQKIMLVERRSYKFKADRTLRQNAAVMLERVRIDIEDLDLHGIRALQGHHYIAFSKHLCGHATDLTLRCCRPNLMSQSPTCYLDGIAIATCCHHICQWKPYVNKQFFKDLGFSKKEFHILTWLTSGAVSGIKEHSADSGSHSTCGVMVGEARESLTKSENAEEHAEERMDDVKKWLVHLADRAELGLKCKRLLDIGRFYWLKQVGMNSKLVAYVSPEITPENTLLLANHV